MKARTYGNLTRDAETKEIKPGTVVTEFTVAEDAGKDREGERLTNFIKVSIFGCSPAFANLLKKGARVIAEGKLTVTTKLDKDGEPVSYLNINAPQAGIDIINLAKLQEGEAPRPQGNAPRAPQGRKAAPADELPF